MEGVVSNSLDYSKKGISHGSYIYTKITPNNGNSSVSASVSGGEEVIFELSQKVFNLAKSNLNFYVKYPEEKAGGATNYYTWANMEGVPQIRQIQFYTRDNVYMADIPNFHKYMNGVGRYMTKAEVLQCRDKLDIDEVAVDDTNVYAKGLFEGLHPCRSANIGYNRDGEADTATPYLEPIQCAIGSTTANPRTNSGDLYFAVSIPLRNIFDSIFSLDKDVYFGEITYIRIVFNSTPLMYWYSTSATVPTTASIAANASATISDIHLNLAIENNPVVVQSVMDKVNGSGLSLNVPYVNSFKFNLSGTNQVVSQKFNRSHGRRLRRCWWIPYHATETKNTAYDHRNGDAGATEIDIKVSDYYIMLNNVRLNQQNYDCSKLTDYKDIKDLLVGSSIFSSLEFIYNFAYPIDFTEGKSPLDLTLTGYPKENLLDGLPLDQEHLLSIQATTANATHNHYLFAICDKELTITANGATFM